MAWHFRPSLLGHRAGIQEQGEMDSVCQHPQTTCSIKTMADTLGSGLNTSNRAEPTGPPRHCPRANMDSSTL